MDSIKLLTPSTLVSITLVFLIILGVEKFLSMVPSKPVERERMQSLDGLRGLLSISVFVGHFMYFYFYFNTGEWGGPTHWYDPLLGSNAVTLFFMLTGFLFGLRLLNKGGRLNWADLYNSRIFRIVPLYWFMVAMLAVIVYWMTGTDLIVKVNVFFKEIAIWLSFTDHPNINKYAATYVIVAGVVWTIKYEWLFYLSLPVQAIFVRLSTRRQWVLLILAAIILGIAFMPQSIGYRFLQIKTMYVLYFLVGELAAWLYTREKYRNWARSKWGTMIALAGIACASMFFHTDFNPWQTIFMAVFFIPVALGNTLLGLLEFRFTRYLGTISYGLYLLHGMIIFTIFGIIFPDAMSRISSLPWLYLALILTAVMVISICSLTYYLIEKPFIRLGKLVSTLINNVPAIRGSRQHA